MFRMCVQFSHYEKKQSTKQVSVSFLNHDFGRCTSDTAFPESETAIRSLQYCRQ